MSYRWKETLQKTSGRPNPDDESRTQYHRMVHSAQELISLKGWDPARVGLWVDYGCIEQDDPVVKDRGVNSLAAVIRQVDAMISLVDDQYFERAWCSVEVEFVQRMRRKNGVPLWFADTEGHLGRAPTISTTLEAAHDHEGGDPETLKLSYESDRPKVRFLFLQASLI
jgi:hypothetical protein